MFKKSFIALLLSNLLLANSNNTLYLGEVYEFAEKNLLELIQEHLIKNKDVIEKRANQAREEAKENIKNYKPKGMIPLTPATRDREFSPDLTYTLTQDIKDIKGNIIYPQGFTFNPAKYAKISYGIVVINANNPKELEWLEQSDYLNTIAYRIFLSDGSYYEMVEKYKQSFYYLLPEIAKRFALKHTPSIIKQQGEKIIVNEICLECKDKQDNTRGAKK